MHYIAKKVLVWFIWNFVPLIFFLGLIYVSTQIANYIHNQFTVEFPYEQTGTITNKWEDDVERVQDFSEQLSFLSSFIRLKFDSPISFRQEIIVSVTRRQLAAGASLPVEASSQPDGELISTGGVVEFSSSDATYCDLSILDRSFSIKEARATIEMLAHDDLPTCIKNYLSRGNFAASELSGQGQIYSLIRVSPDTWSWWAIYMVSLLFVASIALVLLKLYKMIKEFLHVTMPRTD